MKTVVLGKTGIISPKNAFGALPIQRISQNDAAKLLQKAYQKQSVKVIMVQTF